MTSQLITIQYADITGESDTGKSVEITRAGKPDVEIPYEAGQALSIVQSGVNYQLTATAGDGQWIIEHDDLGVLDAYKTTLEGLFPASSPGGSGATLAEQQAQTTLLEEIKDLLDEQTAGLTWSKTVVAITTLSVDLLLANPARKAAIINNRPGGAIVYFDISGGICTTDDKQIPSNAYYSFTKDDRPANKVTGRRASGTGSVTIYEGV